MRTTAISLLALLLLFVIAFAWMPYSKQGKKIIALYGPDIKKEYLLSSGTVNELKMKSSKAKLFIRQNDFDTSFCFMIDLSLPSNHKRFFVYDMKKDSATASGLVTHGNCNEYWLEGKKYGNAVGCGCSSLGKYKVGNSYYGKFGLAYKLHGLEKTSSNAYRRYVVLHSHECVPDVEVQREICQSNGCPTVSPSFLKHLQTVISQSRKPILLWIYGEKL